MERTIKGRTWKFGDNLCNDVDILEACYALEHLIAGVPLEKLTQHVMKRVNPEFAGKVKRGDIVVAGKNYGYGKPHREGTEMMKMLGVGAIVVASIPENMFKNTLYFGLPVLIRADILEKVSDGDQLEVDVVAGDVVNLSSGETFKATPVVPEGHALFPIMEAGGLIPYIKQKLASKESRA